MDSVKKEQLFDTMKMSLLLGYSDAARYVFNDALQLIRDETIEECIDLALKKDPFFLVVDFEMMKNVRPAPEE